MSEPLNLGPLYGRMERKDYSGKRSDIFMLLAEVDRLRDEISDRANVEADLRAQLAEAQRERS